VTTRTSKDPLGATVVALPCKMTLPLSDSRTCQRWALMFVSTSKLQLDGAVLLTGPELPVAGAAARAFADIVVPLGGVCDRWAALELTCRPCSDGGLAHEWTLVLGLRGSAARGRNDTGGTP